MNTGRIDIQGQRSFCATSLTVSRTLPAILGGHMSDYEWNQFCDSVDMALEPASKAKKKLAILGSVSVLFCMVGFLVFGLLFATSASSHGGPSFATFALPIACFVLFGLVTCASSIYISKESEKTRQELTRVCEEQSARNRSISFHVREETRIVSGSDSVSTYHLVHLEVQVATEAGGSASPSSYYASASTNPLGKSVETRLEELERLKHHLTEEEYQRKREDILTAV